MSNSFIDPQDVMKQDMLSDSPSWINEVKGPSLAEIQDMKRKPDSETINPSHYNDIPEQYQHHRVVTAHGFDWYTASALKYLFRAGKKSSAGMSQFQKTVDDLNKAKQYIDMKLKEMQEGRV